MSYKKGEATPYHNTFSLQGDADETRFEFERLAPVAPLAPLAPVAPLFVPADGEECDGDNHDDGYHANNYCDDEMIHDGRIDRSVQSPIDMLPQMIDEMNYGPDVCIPQPRNHMLQALTPLPQMIDEMNYGPDVCIPQPRNHMLQALTPSFLPLQPSQVPIHPLLHATPFNEPEDTRLRLDAVSQTVTSPDNSEALMAMIRTMSEELTSLRQKFDHFQSSVSCRDQTMTVGPTVAPNFPVVNVVPVPSWGTFSEMDIMDNPKCMLYLLPEWQAQRLEDPVKFTRYRCNPTIQIVFCGDNVAAHNRELLEMRTDAELNNPGQFKICPLDNSMSHYHDLVNQAATILFLGFKGMKKAHFKRLIMEDDVIALAVIDRHSNNVASVCLLRTASISKSNCSGSFNTSTTTTTPFVIAVLYMSTARPYRRMGLGERIVHVIKQRVDQVPNSIMSIQSAYFAVDFWKKYATHTRLAINVIWALYELNAEAFFICQDTIEFVYFNQMVV